MAIGIGLIGTGFMGKAHALAWRNANAVMGGLPAVRLVHLCDTPLEKAREMAGQFGFETAGDDWQALIADPAVEVVSITTPNALHRPMAEAALAAGKHVWCEKPLGVTLADAEAMAAASGDRLTLVGYNYLRNPAFTHACRLVAEGRIGRLFHLRGWVDEDYQADETLPWTWRCRASEAGLGALGDIGVHLVSLLTALGGPIDSVVAEMGAAYATRPLPEGGEGVVENEDLASALVRFRAGFHGALTISRAAWGRKGSLGFEAHGSSGMIVYDQERMNELQLYTNDGPKSERGFRTILTGPEHAPYGAFCPAPGHGLGFNDLKTIEAAQLLAGLAGGPRPGPDFAEALEIERVVHAIAASARDDGRRVTVAAVRG
ncbi:Gfo/Idh/MocA family protein [Aurantimonas sp. HBX-1]|uniref:Gfo/Idh/MocA family protein n=1 Tax=Aurantimonas sp. HBX-1 TaxID=2906072 RepID=UPI001F29373D|nr:Gfo/Idh/MocA family oxidoreductase [Aurantimonas sp. HBX-1]UIJ72540.1 Gfo/Idh/MocA family oxidoreductase [Aurantimonas sp. HBX-1]